MAETAEKYQGEFDDWYKKYDVREFVDTDERDRVAALDPSLVWTQHTTCENEKITNGFSEFEQREGSCGCWQTVGWYVAARPWTGGEETFVQLEACVYLPCPACNADGEEDQGQDGCETCEGNGYYDWYCD